MTQTDRNALISVADKTGLIEFGQGLHGLGWKIIGSRGTKSFLEQAGVPVLDVAELVGGGPILGHKVVTLSREIHAGILADPHNGEEVAQMFELKLPFIDLVCVDMYALEKTLAMPGVTMAQVIEKTDVGGPTMLHAGAKGRRIVLCDAFDRAPVLAWMKRGMPNEEAVRLALAAKAERAAASYIAASASYLESHVKLRLEELLAG